jgi:hypothetical protein
MSYARKYALAAAVVWALVLGGLLTAVLGPGIDRFTAPEHQMWRLLTAAIILPGFLFDAWRGWRLKRGRHRLELDERDDAIARRAAVATLFIVAVVVYFTSLLLYEAYHDRGAVPVGWLYLLAYGTVATMSLVHAVATLVLDLRGTADG